jgi:CubicO group peptidase (beta-lactamase class C family)
MRALVAALATAASAPILASQQSALAESTVSAIDTLVTDAMGQHGIPGISLAMSENGALVYAKGFGTTSLTSVAPPAADTQ